MTLGSAERAINRPAAIPPVTPEQ